MNKAEHIPCCQQADTHTHAHITTHDSQHDSQLSPICAGRQKCSASTACCRAPHATRTSNSNSKVVSSNKPASLHLHASLTKLSTILTRHLADRSSQHNHPSSLSRQAPANIAQPSHTLLFGTPTSLIKICPSRAPGLPPMIHHTCTSSSTRSLTGQSHVTPHSLSWPPPSPLLIRMHTWHRPSHRSQQS